MGSDSLGVEILIAARRVPITAGEPETSVYKSRLECPGSMPKQVCLNTEHVQVCRLQQACRSSVIIDQIPSPRRKFPIATNLNEYLKFAEPW